MLILQAVKRRLKSIGPLYRTNARWKSWRLKLRNRGLADFYRREADRRALSYSEEESVALLRQRLAARGLPRSIPVGQKPRVLWVGTNWNQDNSGFLSALQRCAEVRAVVDWNGEYGLRSDSPLLYDPSLVKRNSQMLVKQIAEFRRNGPVDLVFGQMWANFLSPDALRHARDAGAVTVNLALDDRLPEHWAWHHHVRLGAVGLCAAVDLTLTTSPEALVRYWVEDCPAVFFAMASDANIFRPSPESEKEFDVTFVGARYGIRAEIVDALQHAGVSIDAFGPGWPNGPVSAERAAEIFSRSRIILGIGTVGHNHDVYTLKLRDFDAPMAGALYLTHRNPDLTPLYEEGQEIVCYASIDECIEKVRYYLSHPEERMSIAARGLQRARREHTWDRRFEYLFNIVGLRSQRDATVDVA